MESAPTGAQAATQEVPARRLVQFCLFSAARAALQAGHGRLTGRQVADLRQAHDVLCRDMAASAALLRDVGAMEHCHLDACAPS